MRHLHSMMIGCFILLPALSASALGSGSSDRKAQTLQEESMKAQHDDDIQLATLGGGCFWCLEAAYERIEGVQSVSSGYAGGTTVDPTYQQVCSGTTGHAEVVQIAYDPEKISYRDILELFWKVHDPTTLNRQGADVGSQYRSIILYHNQEQKRISEEYIEELEASGVFSDPIVTQVEPLRRFYPAEDYHQDFYAKNPMQGYCAVVIRPKLKKLGLEH